MAGSSSAAWNLVEPQRVISKETAKSKVPGRSYTWTSTRWRRLVLRIQMRRMWAWMGSLVKIVKAPEMRHERARQELAEMKKANGVSRRRVQNPALPRAVSKLSRSQMLNALEGFAIPHLEDYSTKELVDIMYNIPKEAKKGETKININQARRRRSR